MAIADSIQQPNPPPAVLPETPTASPQLNPGITSTAYNPQQAEGVLAAPTGNSDNFITDNSLVENRLNELYKTENPYMKAARTKAMQGMNANNTANSTMAASAGEYAAIMAGLEIARPDAATYSTAALQNQQGAIASAAAQQQATNQGILQNQQGAIAHDQTNQQAALTGALNQQQHAMNMDSAQFQAAIASASAQQQAEITNQQRAMEMKFNEGIQTMNLSADARNNIAGMYQNASASLISNIQNILVNPDLNQSAKSAAIKLMQDNFYADMETAAHLAGVELEFT
jgi:hypothetical protein